VTFAFGMTIGRIATVETLAILIGTRAKGMKGKKKPESESLTFGAGGIIVVFACAKVFELKSEEVYCFCPAKDER